MELTCSILIINIKIFNKILFWSLNYTELFKTKICGIAIEELIINRQNLLQRDAQAWLLGICIHISWHQLECHFFHSAQILPKPLPNTLLLSDSHLIPSVFILYFHFVAVLFTFLFVKPSTNNTRYLTKLFENKWTITSIPQCFVAELNVRFTYFWKKIYEESQHLLNGKELCFGDSMGPMMVS